MAFYRAQVEILRAGALPEDVIVNTLHFDSDIQDVNQADQDDITARLEVFYDTVGVHFAEYLSETVTVTYYDMSQPTPRVPLEEVTFTIPPTTGASFPAELAIALSMVAAPAPGVNAARRRGRIYLGPLLTSVGTPISNGIGIQPAVRTTIADAGFALRESATPGFPRLAIFSPTTLAATGSLDEAFNDVATTYVDNAFDIQRRRGLEPTTRTPGA